MKKKFLAAFIIAGSLFVTACQEDTTLDEMIQDTETSNEMEGGTGTGTGSGGDGDNGNGSGGVGGN